MLDIARNGRYNEYVKGRCDKRLTPTLTVHSKATKDRHLAEWRSLLFTMIVTVNRPICNVIRIAPPPFRDGVSQPPAVLCSALVLPQKYQRHNNTDYGRLQEFSHLYTIIGA